MAHNSPNALRQGIGYDPRGTDCYWRFVFRTRMPFKHNDLLPTVYKYIMAALANPLLLLDEIP